MRERIPLVAGTLLLSVCAGVLVVRAAAEDGSEIPIRWEVDPAAATGRVATTGTADRPPVWAAEGGSEIPIRWEVDPAAATGRVATTGTADRPLTEWTALEVAVESTYTVYVGTVYGERILEARGEGSRQYALTGSDPLWLSYTGPAPAQVRLYGRELRMAPGPAGEGLVRYDTGRAVVPAGATYRAEMVNLQPGSGTKVALVCARWGGGGGLRVLFRDAASGAELGYTDLSPERTCSPVWGRVNRPFVVEVTAADTVQLYDLILH